MVSLDLSLCEPPFRRLYEQAAEVATQAYSPYSGVQVGCALMSARGVVYLGSNVENASYGLTVCAERTAISQGVSAEGPDFRWVMLAVVALGHEFPPCGACRQVLAEFGNPSARVGFVANGYPTIMSIGDLLPSGFSKQSLLPEANP